MGDNSFPNLSSGLIGNLTILDYDAGNLLPGIILYK